MYYATELFIKKGALGKIWLAGTIFKKLTKKAILESDIEELCQQVLEPPVPLAISTCGRLTLGIVRIHDKIIHYLLLEATEAQAKLRTIVVKSAINLPIDQMRARPEQITIHRVEDVADLADVDLAQADFLERTLPINKRGAESLLARPEEITLEEEARLPMDEDHRQMDLDYDIEFGREEPLIDFDFPRSPSMSMKPGEIGHFEMPNVSLKVSETSVPPIPPQLSVTPIGVESAMHIEPLIEEKEKTPEELTQIQLMQQKREMRRRFPRDNLIEFKDAERLIEDEKWEQHLIERPQFVHLGERKLEEDGFQRLLGTSLTGLIPQDSILAHAYSRFSNYITEPVATQRDIQEEIEISIPPTDIEIARQDEEEKGSIPSSPGPSVPSIFYKGIPRTDDDRLSIPSRYEQIQTGRKSASSTSRVRMPDSEESSQIPRDNAMSSEE